MILSKISFKNLLALSPSVLLKGGTLELLFLLKLLFIFCKKNSEFVIFVIFKNILKD